MSTKIIEEEENCKKTMQGEPARDFGAPAFDPYVYDLLADWLLGEPLPRLVAYFRLT